ncbi:hypothetical protein K443DRAFT_14850 [Laccaria amethystina LaAM-08-1]|uniref:Uncharacterized protein n=1 Tax=Laccaria amethystina LaAM-08-1 TaxID=1095629 RepID=A0A0C9WSB2_9AGAR|nr:hypothetical protein K443DRAFT_14850 [Laccaria amethystina LaAM-08-1]
MLDIIMTELTIVSVVVVVMNFGGSITEIDIKTIPHGCHNKLLLPFMRDELRLKLLTPPIDGEVELDEDGSPPIIWAKAELSVPVVYFNYGVQGRFLGGLSYAIRVGERIGAAGNGLDPEQSVILSQK